jgi:nucleoside-diphosphate-sugar epimerase
MRLLVLGGTALTGPFAVRRLHALGHRVTVFHRGEHECELPAGVRHMHGDLAYPPRELFDPAPEVVVHMWAMTEEDAESFVDTFRVTSARVIAVSSGDVYRAYGRLQGLESGPPDPMPLTEDAPLRESRYPYRSHTADQNHWMARYDKILVERILLNQTELPATILRFPAVLGRNEHRRFRRWLQPMLRGDAELRVQDDWAAWHWTHGFAEDVAEAVVLAVDNPAAAGRIYNVGERRTPTMAERLSEFARVAGWRGRIIKVPATDLPETDRMSQNFAHHLAYDTTRIRSELGYKEIVPRERSLECTLELEREE